VLPKEHFPTRSLSMGPIATLVDVAHLGIFLLGMLLRIFLARNRQDLRIGVSPHWLIQRS
jgi:hypothetical protein